MIDEFHRDENLEDVNESSMRDVCPEANFEIDTSESAIQIRANMNYDYPSFVAFLITLRNIKG